MTLFCRLINLWNTNVVSFLAFPEYDWVLQLIHLSRSFTTRTGLRQGDSLSCLLFNLALEKAIRDSQINTRGTILNKSIQLLAYADDTDLIARTKRYHMY